MPLGAGSGLLQVDAAPIFGASLNAGARSPGEAGSVDIFAGCGGAFVAVVDEQVEAQATRDFGGAGDQGERDGGPDSVAIVESGRCEAKAGGCLFHRAGAGIGVAGGADAAGGVEGEDAHLEAGGGVLGARGGVEADLDRIAAPMTADVVWFDVGDHGVIADLDLDV